jgi:hypothetical protein
VLLNATPNISLHLTPAWLFTNHGWAAKLSLIVASGANPAQVNSIVGLDIRKLWKSENLQKYGVRA